MYLKYRVIYPHFYYLILRMLFLFSYYILPNICNSYIIGQRVHTNITCAENVLMKRK